MKNISLHAFTLLEMLVVIGIISVVIVLGVAGLRTFQRTVELQLGQDQAQNEIKATRNMAENNILPIDTSFNPNLLYGYSLDFNNNDMIRTLCSRPDNGPWSCSGTSRSVKSEQLSNIEYRINPLKGCSEILFENLTGDIKVKWPSDSEFQDQECEFDIKHKNEGTAYFRIVVNGISNTFSTVNIVQYYNESKD